MGIFEAKRVSFAGDLLRNQLRSDVSSRFSLGFGRPLVETEVAVRSLVAWPCGDAVESEKEIKR